MALSWRELVFPRPMTADQAVARLRALADDPTAPLAVLEVRSRWAALGAANSGRAEARTCFLVGAAPPDLTRVVRLLDAVALPVDLNTARQPLFTARRLVVSTDQRPLDAEAAPASCATILAALSQANAPDEELAVQLILGRRLPSRLVPADAGSAVPLKRLLVGHPASNPTGQLSAPDKAALTAKLASPGFAALLRLGVSAASSSRRRDLLLGLLGAYRRLEQPGVSFQLRPDRPERFGSGAMVWLPWRWPLRANAAEATALAVLPVGEADLPGLTPLHPRPLAPPAAYPGPDSSHALVAVSTAPACAGAPLTRSLPALLRHTHVIGPTGTGKTVLLLNLALQDIAAGRGAVVVEPKGDLVEDLLARMPADRLSDVVLVDPLRPDGVVGLNPLSRPDAAGGRPRSPELRADAVFSIFRDLFGDQLGVRSADILQASLLTLARRPDASLVQIPVLLTDPSFRRPRVAAVSGDLALGPFWAWYEGLRPGEQANVIAPLMNKLRAVIMKPSIRRVLGQTRPRFDVREVFTKGRILLAPLPANHLGEEGAALLGSLLVSQVWDAALAQAAVPPEQRRPTAIYLDEAQKFLRLDTDLADALATSRSYGVGWTLAHQYLGQLPPALREALLANARSRVVFQASPDDAAVFAKAALSGQTAGVGEAERLTPADFTSLPAFQVYASLFAGGQTQPYASGRTLPPPAPSANPAELRRGSARRYGRTAEEIEAEFAAWANRPPQPNRDGAQTGDEVAGGETLGRKRRAT
jgi:hypothetical protein